MDDIKLNLGNKIRILREIKGLSQENMAHSLKISQQAYQKIEDGTTKLTIERASTISKELDVDLDTLLNFHPTNILFKPTQSGVINTNNLIPSKLIENYEAQILYLKNQIENLQTENKLLIKKLFKE